MKRENVYKLIDGERDYQDSLAPSRTDGSRKTVGDYITMLQYYQTKLVEAWTVNAGTEEAKEVMRKIAGIAVHCIEDHGAPPRTESKKQTNKLNRKYPRGYYPPTPIT